MSADSLICLKLDVFWVLSYFFFKNNLLLFESNFFFFNALSQIANVFLIVLLFKVKLGDDLVKFWNFLNVFLFFM